MIVKKIEIRNFSTNKKLDIELSPQVTTITGQSFKGKSAAFRALKWIMRGIPAGNQFINWDSDKTSVRLTLNNRKKLTRKKGKGISLYRYDGKEYTAFGNEVPAAISKVLNVSDINFQGQHEPPFWFCKTAGEVSRALNSIVNLEKISTTLHNIASKIRKTKATIELIQKRLEEALERKKELTYVKELNQDLIYIERIQKTLREKTTKLATVREILKLVVKYREDRDGALARMSVGQIMVDKGEIYKDVGERFQSLSGLIKSIESTKESECQAKEKLEFAKEELEKVVTSGGRCPLCGNLMKKK